MKNYKISDHFNGTHFHNQSGTAVNKTFRDLLKWQRTRQRAKWPKQVANKCLPQVATTTKPDEIHLTFINHVTFLMQSNGLNILTDPVFSLRASPFQALGPKRVRPPGLALEALPKIDFILLSHNHYDHMDIASLKFLDQRDQPRIITPLGNGQNLQSEAKLTRWSETDWWEQTELSNGSTVFTTPAQHWSARGLRDRNMALWGGFVLQTPKRKIFFAGDTGYAGHFREIRERLGIMDISLLPIGAYEPRWFMREQHMNPEDAVKAHLDLQSRLSIGTHFGTFQLTDEAIDAPTTALIQAMKAANVSNFAIMEVGETRIF